MKKYIFLINLLSQKHYLICLFLSGRDLLDWIGLGVGPDKDPYVAKTNTECINGDLAECFKSRALQSFEEFFDKVR